MKTVNISDELYEQILFTQKRIREDHNITIEPDVIVDKVLTTHIGKLDLNVITER